jgi:hypothetical protein
VASYHQTLKKIKKTIAYGVGAGMPYEEPGCGVRPGDVRLVPLRQEDASPGVLSLQPLRYRK